MSGTPASRATDSAAGNSTRVLLDELDALMQKMLALPVNQLADEDAVADKTPQRTPAADTPRLSPPELPRAPHFIAGPLIAPSFERPGESPFLASSAAAQAQEVAGQPDLVSNHFSPPEYQPLQNDPLTTPDDAGDFAFREPGASAEVSKSILTNPAARPATRVPRSAASPGAILVPLWWCNRVFDRGTHLLGPLGLWLRSLPGRSTLGWLGLALWAAAVVWGLLKWIG